MKTHHRVTVTASFLLLVCVLLCGFLKPGQKPVLTVKDTERGNEAALYETDMGGDSPHLLYVNERYGYSALIPPAMAEAAVTIPDNGDGLILASKDGRARYRASGGMADFVEGGLKGAFEEALKNAGPDISEAVFNNNERGTAWTLFWTQGGMVHKRGFTIRDGDMFDCELSYPASEQEKYGTMTDIAVVNSGYKNNIQ